MRKAEERTPATWRRVGGLLDLVTSTGFANYLANSGYASFQTQLALQVSVCNPHFTLRQIPAKNGLMFSTDQSGPFLAGQKKSHP